MLRSKKHMQGGLIYLSLCNSNEESAIHRAAHWQTFRQTLWSLKLWQSPSVRRSGAVYLDDRCAVCVRAGCSHRYIYCRAMKSTPVSPQTVNKSIYQAVESGAPRASPNSLTHYCTAGALSLQGNPKSKLSFLRKGRDVYQRRNTHCSNLWWFITENIREWICSTTKHIHPKCATKLMLYIFGSSVSQDVDSCYESAFGWLFQFILFPFH